MRLLRSVFCCFSVLNKGLLAAKEGNLYALMCETSGELLSQRKEIHMLADKHCFEKSLGFRRTGLFTSTALPLLVLLLMVQLILPASAANARTTLHSVTLSAGCISPSDCLSKMTLPEKEGQMTQVEKNAFSMTGNSISDITTYFIGSVLSGGGGGPNGAGGTATQWADMVDNFQSYALQTRLGIPLIYGADAVHGHNNVYGATLFPHNIGLGAMHDPTLITQVEQVTRDEVLGTGVRWTFAPCVCTPQDIRWGRTYEGYSEVPSDNATNGAAAIVGFQGSNGALGPTNILATAKHFIGDGHTAWGTGSPYLNEGDDQITEQQLDTIDLPPYQSAVSNKVGSVMISYSSWNGVKDHANQYLITTKLKGTGTDSYGTPDLGFQGFVVSDWQAINQISSDYNYDVRTAINAGIDMIMVPDDYKTFISTLDSEIKAGNIPMSRIDDAVTRILTAKFALGLFTQPNTNHSYTPNVGSAAHRAVARQAERESLVLLKNNGVLPLSKTGSYTLVVGGDHADNLGYQLGGWSISWQGGSGTTTIGTTLWQAIQQAGLSSSVKLNFVGTRTRGHYRGDVGIVAVGETPYAEGNGDTNTLALSSTDATEVSDVCSRVTKCLVLLFSGRPIIINTQLNQSSAFVAAWIGSTEGEGITDVLFGDYGFRGKLTYTWPNSVTQEPCNQNNGCTGTLFPYGYGITPF
jgi:beta-glucosidase